VNGFGATGLATGRRRGLADSCRMARIELTSGQQVKLEGVDAAAVLSELYNAGRDRYAEFQTPDGRQFVNPTQVVRVIED
jgi:hypothetical protein